MRWLTACALTLLALAPAEAGKLGGAAPAVKMTVRGLRVVQNNPVVLLETDGGKQLLPIWIGPAEAQSIQLRLSGSKPLRPLTHDLLETMLSVLGAKVQRVEVDDLQDNVFLGKISLADGKGRRYRIDGRPSDLIALALGAKQPVWVAPHVLKRAGVSGTAPSVWTGGGSAPTP
jgi:bifunctional DNase/RNase